MGKEVARLRKAHHLTQKELAERADIARSTLARFEVGQLPEFGLRKLILLLSAMGSTLVIREENQTGSTLDELLREREQHHGPS